MRNPNKYGTIIKLKRANLRNPYAVRLFKGYTDDGKAIRPYLGYYKTRKDAAIALAMYNNNPYDLDSKTTTFGELYQIWSERHYEKISQSSVKSYKSAYKHLESIANKPIKELKKVDLDNCIDNCGAGKSTKNQMLSIIKFVYRYAMQNDIIEKNYSEYVEPPKRKKGDKKIPRQIFTAEEIQKLWDNVDTVPYVDTILILIYTGLRVNEMLALKKEDFDFNLNILKVNAAKTKSGIRAVPIAQNILPLVKKRWMAAATYFIERQSGIRTPYITYKFKFDKLMASLELNLEHRPHDTRHTFATLLSEVQANTASVKKLIGHSSYDITLQHYTHSSVEELQKAVNLLADID